MVWLAVTFLTPPEEEQVLRGFYLKVRPGGRGWTRVSSGLGLGGEPIDGGPLNWTNWVAGVTSVYSSLFGVGQIIFGATGRGVVLLVVAMALLRLDRPEPAALAREHGPVPGRAVLALVAAR